MAMTIYSNLSDAELSDLECVRHVSPRNPLATDGINWGVILSVVGCLAFWAVVAVACILSDDAAWFVSRAFVAAFGFGCLAAIVLGAGRH